MAKVKIPLAQRIELNKLFKKIAASLGYSDSFSFNFGEQLDDSSRTADLSTLYVDGTNGLDTNPGSSNLPFKTIMAAVNSLPDKAAGIFTINVAAGTYTEKITISKDIIGRLSTIDIVGEGWKTPTLASGVTTTTGVTNNNAHRYTFAGAGWTAGDLKGKFIHPTENATAAAWDYYLPIHNNGTDWIDIMEISGNITGFTIVEPSVEIINTASDSYCLEISNNGARVPTSNGGTTTAEDYGLRFFKLKFTDVGTRGVGLFTEGSQGFFWCTFNAGTKPLFYMDGTKTHFYRCSAYASSAQVLYYLGRPSLLNLQKSSLYNIGTYAKFTGHFAHLTANNCLFESGTNAAYFINTGSYGVYSIGTSSKILGYQYAVFDDAADQNGGGNRFVFSNTDITGTAGGIFLRGSHSNILLLGTTNVHDCGGFGVKVCHGSGGLGTHNRVYVANTCTMSNNTSGDFTIDGVTGVSLAAILADPDKTMTDPIYLNILCAS